RRRRRPHPPRRACGGVAPPRGRIRPRSHTGIGRIPLEWRPARHEIGEGRMMRARSLPSSLIGAALALIATALPGIAQDADSPGRIAPPKLVLFMVVDGFPQEQLVKYYDQYGEGGLKRLLDEGAWYGNNHYSHATTYTGVGHATLLTCAHPYKH